MLLVCLFQFVSPLLYLVSLNNIHQEQAQKLINYSQFETIELSLQQYQQSTRENGKELSVQGKWYDVKTTKLQGNKVFCSVLKDEDETKLNLTLKNDVQKDKKQPSPTPAFFFWLATLPPPQHPLLPFPYSEKKTVTLLHIQLLNGIQKDLLKPPCFLV